MDTAMLGKILKVLGGAGAGGGFGFYATPQLFGYQEVPAARRTAGTLDAILGGTLAGIDKKNLGALYKGPKITPENVGTILSKRLAIPTAAVAAETIPIAQAGLHQQREAAREVGTAAQQLAGSQAQYSVPGSLKQLLSSNVGRGAGIGAAGAGLAAILTGLKRRQTEGELEERTPRNQMVAKDFLKYMIPAILAGGIAGSFVPKRQQ
jgi:hypothetical protein